MNDFFMEGVLGRRQQYELQRAELELDRSSFDSHWRDLGENIAPRRMRFTTTDVNRGDKRNNKIIDTTPIFAARTLRAGMMSGITSPARPWFRLTTPDPDLAKFGAVKQWLDTVRELMAGRFLRSNLYQALPTLYGDMGTFATGAMAVLEDSESTIRCTPFPIGEYYLANDEKGRVRVFMRKFRWTVRQLVGKFGRRDAAGRITDWSNFSVQVKNAWDQKRLGTMIDVVHLIQENLDYNPRYLESRFKRFTDCYYEMGAQTGYTGEPTMLQEKGFDEFPILCGRWDLTAGDVYGTDCPGMTALGDIKQLQHGEKSAAQILDKINKPPMIASTDMMNSTLSQLPGGVSYVNETSEKKFRAAIDVSAFRFDFHEQKLSSIRTRVERAFYADLFLMLEGLDRDYTATEIIERKEEKLLALGPMLENTNQDVLDPLIDRTFAIMDRNGDLPPAPAELEGQTLRVDYVSVMAQAQKAIGRSGMQGFISFIGEVAAAKGGDPSAFDKVDTDALVDEAGEMFGIPTRIILPNDQVVAVREQRAKATASAQQAATLKEAAMGAKSLSQADTQGKNALTDVLNQAGNSAAGAAA